MARIANAPNTKLTAAKRKPGRPAGIAQKIPAKVAKPPATAKRGSVVTPAPPKLSKNELRAQVERLEDANATLRAKRKEANLTAKASAARIAELEAQVGELEKKVTSSTAPAKGDRKPAKSPRLSRPTPLDEAVETTVEKLEERLGDF